MKFGDRERKAVIILFALIYLYAFFQYNIKNSIPGIKENNTKIAEISAKLDQLEADYKHIEDRKRELERYKTANVRYTDYIAQNADYLETMEYMEKVKRLFNGKITGVAFVAPLQVQNANPPYYEFTTNFVADLNMSELLSFMGFIEGGTKKVKVTNFVITPKIADNAGPNVKPIMGENANLTVNIGMTMYSMELGSIERRTGDAQAQARWRPAHGDRLAAVCRTHARNGRQQPGVAERVSDG